MEYKVLTEEDFRFFVQTIGEENVLLQNLENYTHDATEQLIYSPDLVLKPKSTQQVAQIVKYCNQELLPITPRGAGTGLAGGALAIKGGVLLSLERMNQIISVDENNLQVTVESGVINQVLQQELEKKNLFFPPDPSSWGSSFIGGNIATNAGGPRAVKYGVTANYVLNLEVVLPNGEIIWTGANTLKNSTGYNLTQLYVGSEGTLGVITKAVLKVKYKPLLDVSLLIPFKVLEEASQAVSALFKSGLNPSAIEFMERYAIATTIQFLDEVNITLEDEVEAHLLIMFDGNSIEELMEDVQKTNKVLEQFNIGEILFADNEVDKNRLWQIRRKMAEVVKTNGYTIEEDTVVPRANLPQLVKKMHQLAQKHQYKVVCYGHAGDGNLHIRINHPIHKNSYQVPQIQKILEELFSIVKELGGTISGEHGIGLIQKKYLPIVFSSANLNLQKAIKNTIDPNNIMNPCKVIIT